MNDLQTVSKLVKGILEENKQARNSDSHLYLKVLEQKAKESGIDLKGMTVPFFLESYDVLGVPGFETVRRTRQKVQATYPELASAERVAAMRMENEKVFKAFALGGLE